MTADQIQILRDRVNLLVACACELNADLRDAMQDAVEDFRGQIDRDHDNNLLIINAHSQQITSAIDALVTPEA